MNIQDWKKIKSIFEKAIELPQSQRYDFVEKECSENESIKHEIVKDYYLLLKIPATF